MTLIADDPSVVRRRNELSNERILEVRRLPRDQKILGRFRTASDFWSEFNKMHVNYQMNYSANKYYGRNYAYALENVFPELYNRLASRMLSNVISAHGDTPEGKRTVEEFLDTVENEVNILASTLRPSVVA